MCGIVEKMQRTDEQQGIIICPANKKRAHAELKELEEKLGLDTIQVLILTAIMHQSYRYHIDGDDVARFLGLEYLKFLSYDAEIENLRQKGYIRIDREGYFVVPQEVKNALKSDKPVTPEPTVGLSTLQILRRIKHLLHICKRGQMDSDEVCDEICAILKDNPETSISRAYAKYIERLCKDESVVFFCLIYRYWFCSDDMVGWHDLDDYFEEDDFDDLRSQYAREDLSLQIKKIIEYAGNDMALMNKDYFRIKDEIKSEIFEDVGGIRKVEKERKVSSSRKVESGSIGKKELFYNDSEKRQVSQLKDLISPKNYDDIRSRMRERGMRSAFTCLLYGGPGTGKTETVYQLARECGRDLFIVDVSQIKSCWVGESEKNIKDVFEKYRACVKAGGPVPLLLFNEADAIFGVRPQGAASEVDKMENAIQNIILQEMEDLDGILIATTNLIENLDKAFERRFLYKIRFNNPSPEAKRKIWKSMLPDLSDSDASLLAERFELSGGQIENVARKKMIQSLLSGLEPSLDELICFCAEESVNTIRQNHKIGF